MSNETKEAAPDMEAEARRAVEICTLIPELEISTVGNVVSIQAADEDEDLLEWSAAIMDKEDAFRIPEEAKAFMDMRTGYPAIAQAYLDEREKKKDLQSELDGIRDQALPDNVEAIRKRVCGEDPGINRYSDLLDARTLLDVVRLLLKANHGFIGVEWRRRSAEAERDAARREVEELKARFAVAKRNLDTCADQRDALRARLAECEPVIDMESLLKLAANESDEPLGVPNGLRPGDLISNGWAGNRNPTKLFVYLRTTKTFIEGARLTGEAIQVYKKDSRIALVLPRTTAHFWQVWSDLAGALAALPDQPMEKTQ